MSDSWPPPDPVFYLLVEWWHDSHCRWNHTDGCSWYYERGPNRTGLNMWSHRSYAEQVWRWLSAPDKPTDIVIERWIRKRYNEGLLTAEDLGWTREQLYNA